MCRPAPGSSTTPIPRRNGRRRWTRAGRCSARAPKPRGGCDMVLMIDNYDSFTYNLVQYLQALGAEVKVERNDELSVEQIDKLAPERIVVSPGTCTPNEAGVSVDVIRQLGARVPILGVCLGHQSVGQA